MSDLPTSLADRAFLVPYDPDRGKLVGGYRQELVVAAALVELTRRGLVTDHDGRIRVSGRRAADPVLDSILDRIADAKPTKWYRWIEKDKKVTYRAVREQLAARRVIRLQERRVLGLVPVTRVTVPDTRAVRQLVTGLRRAATGGAPLQHLDPLDAELLPLVWAVELKTVLTGAERRQHRDRIGELAERAGPAAAGLRRAVQNAQTAASAAG